MRRVVGGRLLPKKSKMLCGLHLIKIDNHKMRKDLDLSIDNASSKDLDLALARRRSGFLLISYIQRRRRARGSTKAEVKNEFVKGHVDFLQNLNILVSQF